VRAKIYVAAPSSDLDRYRRFINLARARGLEVTYDWSPMIVEAQRQRLTDRTISEGFALNAAMADAQGVRDCSVLVLLAPRPGEASIGAWVELGMALGLRTARPTRKPLIVVAGDRADRQYAIFEELADVFASTDEQAAGAAARFAVAMELEDVQGLDLEEIAAAMAEDGGAA
jgi:hypothetical protein